MFFFNIISSVISVRLFSEFFISISIHPSISRTCWVLLPLEPILAPVGQMWGTHWAGRQSVAGLVFFIFTSIFFL